MLEVIEGFFPLGVFYWTTGFGHWSLHFGEEAGKFERLQKRSNEMLYIWGLKSCGGTLKVIKISV